MGRPRAARRPRGDGGGRTRCGEPARGRSSWSWGSSVFLSLAWTNARTARRTRQWARRSAARRGISADDRDGVEGPNGHETTRRRPWRCRAGVLLYVRVEWCPRRTDQEVGLRGEDPVRRAEAGDIVPAGTRVLGRRSGEVVERPQEVRRARRPGDGVGDA